MRSVILVEPEVPENTGFIARLCSNFNYNLKIVNPSFNLIETRKTAKNCQNILRDVIIFDSLEEALEDVDFAVGTKPGKGVACREFQFRKNTSLVFGRESKGLTSKELGLCDAVVHISIDGYRSINLSHAASIVMYEASYGEKLAADHNRLDVVEEKGGKILRNLVARGSPTVEELDQLLGSI